ncbi:AsmA family protein [Vibrio gallicus]|uniref:AsmA family protein n=1 Tax=Vibrio gallicus TaxID=190897 RepID=UPI0021C34C5E|nr:AsmA family protein [Vibrio gallicus]
MKKIALIILTPLLLVVLAVAALLLFVDPNQFKPLIVEQTKTHTQLDLTIEGDIGWRFFPSLGFSLGKTTLSNPEGFAAKNMLSVDEVGLDISVLPMMDKQLQVGKITLKGAQIYLETKADGSSNLDAFKSQAEPEQDTVESPAASEQGSTAAPEPWIISLQGVDIENALLEIKDDSQGVYTKLEQVNLNVASFEFDKWTPVTFSFQGVNNQQRFAVSGQASAKTNADFSDYQVKDVVVSGGFSQPDLEVEKFTLNLDTFAIGSFANIQLTANGKAANNTFEVNSALQAKLNQDMQTFALKDVALQSKLKGPDLDLERASLNLKQFQFDKPGAFNLAIKSKAAGISQDVLLSGSILVDKAISKVAIDNLQAHGNLVGDALPQSPLKLVLESDINFDLKQNKLSVILGQLALNDLSLSGSTQVTLSKIPQVRFKLHSPSINVDEWTGGEEPNAATDASTTSTTSTATASQASTPAQEPDLSVLKTLDVAGTMTIDKLVASNAKLQDVFTNLAIKGGVFNLKALKARLYQGSIDAKAIVNAKSTTPSYDLDAKVKGVKIAPLLKDVADNDMLEGSGNITLDLKGKSLIPDKLKQNIAGDINMSLNDGAVNGINVAQIIRTNYAKFRGQKVPAEPEVKKTDFSSMSASVRLNKGTAYISKINAQSPLMRIDASGQANYIAETMDMLAKTSIVGSLEGQGGKSLDDLKGLTLPIRAKGSWTDPKISLDLAALQKQELERNKKKLEAKAKKEAERGLEKLLGDKAKDDDVKKMTDSLLKKFF